MSDDTVTQDAHLQTTEPEATEPEGAEPEGAEPVQPNASPAGGASDQSEDDSDDVNPDDVDSDDEDSDDEDSDDEDSDDEDPEGGSTLDAEGEIAADYLEELLDIADFDGDIDTYVEGDRAHVSILTEGDVLVGSDGKVLEALQELSRLAVMTETGNRSRLMLDIAGYRDRRRKVLVGLATHAIEDVKSSGQPSRLEPMNPFERKIIHDVVAGAGLTSESEGEEPSRRVVILPTA